MTGDSGGSAGDLLALLDCYGSVTRSDLVRLSGLPRTTVTGIVNDLIDRGLVVEHAAGGSGQAARAGRPARPLSLAGPPALTAVLACGRTGIEAALVTYPGQIVARSSTQEVSTTAPVASS